MMGPRATLAVFPVPLLLGEPKALHLRCTWAAMVPVPASPTTIFLLGLIVGCLLYLAKMLCLSLEVDVYSSETSMCSKTIFRL